MYKIKINEYLGKKAEACPSVKIHFRKRPGLCEMMAILDSCTLEGSRMLSPTAHAPSLDKTSFLSCPWRLAESYPVYLCICLSVASFAHLKLLSFCLVLLPMTAKQWKLWLVSPCSGWIPMGRSSMAVKPTHSGQIFPSVTKDVLTFSGWRSGDSTNYALVWIPYISNDWGINWRALPLALPPWLPSSLPSAPIKAYDWPSITGAPHLSPA